MDVNTLETTLKNQQWVGGATPTVADKDAFDQIKGGNLYAETHPHVFAWSTDPGTDPQRLEGHDDWLMCVRSFPDGRRFVTTGKDGTARIWDAERLELLQTIDLWAAIDPGGMRWPAL